jgi:hypothetical protein
MTPVNPGILTPKFPQDELPAGFPLQKLTQHELEVIEEFLIRRGELSNRPTLARHMLVSIMARLGIPNESVDLNRAEHILSAMYKAVHMNKSE